MKKLLFAIGSIAAIVVMSSCTADSIENSDNETLKTQKQVTSPENQTAIDDPIPPRP